MEKIVTSYSEPDLDGVSSLYAYSEYLNKIGMDNIEKYEKNLREYLIEKLVSIPQVDFLNLEQSISFDG